MTEKTIKKLSSIIRERRKKMQKNSYVSELFKKGKIKIANKLGEEATETASAFLAQGKSEILEESADLIFHLLVLLESADLSFDDVLTILDKRMQND